MATDLGQIKVVPTCICSLCCLGLILLVVMIPLSFKSLAQGRYALTLKWGTQRLLPGYTTDAGMYFLGLGNMFVEYPSTLQSMYFANSYNEVVDTDDHPSIKRGPIRARSKEGLEMMVSVSFQWQMTEHSMRPLYYILGGGTEEQSLYRDEFVRFARAAIIESCANFDAHFFFKNRTVITQDMFEKVVEYFARPSKGLDLSIRGLQLREVDLPDEFDEEIIKTQEQMQEVEIALAEREEQRITLEKDLAVAKERVRQIKTESEGIAEKTRLGNDALVKHTLNLQEKQATANSEILLKFLSDPDPYQRLFELMEIRALSAHNESRILVNL